MQNTRKMRRDILEPSVLIGFVRFVDDQAIEPPDSVAVATSCPNDVAQPPLHGRAPVLERLSASSLE